eukprot:3454429-Prymnesium_polylepis.1
MVAARTEARCLLARQARVAACSTTADMTLVDSACWARWRRKAAARAVAACLAATSVAWAERRRCVACSE